LIQRDYLSAKHRRLFLTLEEALRTLRLARELVDGSW